MTLLFTHPACLRHNLDPDHFESPARLWMVLEALRHPSLEALEWRWAKPAGYGDLRTVHDAPHIERVFTSIREHGLWYLDPDTMVGPGSGAAALYAAGAVLDAVDAVIANDDQTAFCAVRPGGHHAKRGATGGFCLFNNIALGAVRARDRHSLNRVAVVDFDLHHGDGTESVFWNEPGVFFSSIHQWPYDPGTGAPEDRGACGQILNIPLSAGDGSTEFRRAVMDQLLPALDAYRPQLVLVSAGFDAHKDDPLGYLSLVEADYYWIGQVLATMAQRHAGGRLVATLEGGYALDALAASSAAFVKALLDTAPRGIQTPGALRS